LQECLAVARAEGATLGDEVPQERVEAFQSYRPTSALRSSPTDRLVARLNGTAETASCGDAVDRMVSLRRSAIWSCHFWRLRVTDPADIRGRDAHRIPESYFRHDIGHGITARIGAAVRRAISVVRRMNRQSRKKTFFGAGHNICTPETSSGAWNRHRPRTR
jgi:hypothetical protein